MWPLIIIIFILLIVLCYCNRTIYYRYIYDPDMGSFENFIGNRSLSVKKKCHEGSCFRVVKYPHSIEDAVRKLTRLNADNLHVIEYLNNYINQPMTLRAYMARNLLRNYRSENLEEHVPTSVDEVSYVKNKRKMRYCLREKKTGKNKLHEFELLQFMNFHELSHMATTDIGHTERFWKIFKEMLIIAKHLGLHNPVNYRKRPIKLCGLHVDYNPYFDDTL